MADEQQEQLEQKQNSEYKLLRAVDPTKINVPISTKFAKLTLSSNKKKNIQKENDADAAGQQGQTNQEEEEKTQRHSDSRLSRRNLMDSLCAAGVNANQSYENPLLRSTSSSVDWQNVDTQLNTTRHSVMTDDEDVQQQHPQLTQPELNELTMEPLQVSCDELIELSQRISHLTVQNNAPDSAHAPIKTEVSVCISSDDDDNNEEESLCITISSESTVSDNDNPDPIMSCTQPSLDAIAIKVPEVPILSNDKVNRIHAFLRDVSLERQEMKRRGELEISAKKIAAADTESMSQSSILVPYEFGGNDSIMETSISKVNANSSNGKDDCHRLADDDTEVNTITSNDCHRLADDDTEVNTILSNDDELVSNASTPVKHNGKLNASMNKSHKDNSTLNESVTIPETSSEDDEVLNNSDNNDNSTLNKSLTIPETSGEEDSDTDDKNERHDATPKRKETITTAGSTSSETDEEALQLNSINISAKINIKIQISNLQSSSESLSCSSNEYASEQSNPIRRTLTASDEPSPTPTTTTTTKSYTRSAEKQSAQSKSKDKQLALQDTVVQVDLDTEEEEEDENFLTHAEKLLNQLYGKSWQTPDVIRTLKRTSGSGKKETPIATATAQGRQTNDKVQMATKPNSQTTTKKTKSKNAEESILADFSIFKRNICNANNMDSTHLMTPSTRQRVQRTTTEPRIRFNRRQQETPQTEFKRRMPKRVEHKEQERWRQLVDSDSDSEGALASDDEELDATEMISDDDDDSSNSASSEKPTKSNKNKPNEMVYLDLTRDEVTEQEYPTSPTSLPANNDEIFQKRLQDILRTCVPKEKPKLVATPQSDKKTKRKLFNPNLGYEDDAEADEIIRNVRSISDDLLSDLENVYPAGTPVHKRLQEIKRNKLINSGATPPVSKPIFKPPSIASTTKTPKSKEAATPSTIKTKRPTSSTTSKKPNACARLQYNDEEQDKCARKYSFLKSLDACIDRAYCHPLALNYRESYRTKKEELAQYLYDLYNEKIFNSQLKVPLTWNKKLLNTAGRCLNKKRMGTRSSVVELSDKVLTSADRLRCTLLHELCHAATWIFNGEGGHGATWKSWARRSNATFPELPKIGVCHQYEIEYKYTYKCTLCAAKSHAHSKSKKVENIRCAYCHGAIEIFLNKKDKDGNTIATPVKEATGFAKFVKDHYKRFKRPDLKHADVMKILSNEFSNLKMTNT